MKQADVIDAVDFEYQLDLVIAAAEHTPDRCAALLQDGARHRLRRPEADDHEHWQHACGKHLTQHSSGRPGHVCDVKARLSAVARSDARRRPGVSSSAGRYCGS